MPDPSDDAQVVDWSGIVSQVGEDPEVMREIVEAYATEMRQNLDLLPKRIAANDCPEARRAAHTLKGALNMFGAGLPAKLALELEQRCETDAGSQGPLYEQVREAALPVIAELRRFLETGER